jgi:hypothetical protein
MALMLNAGLTFCTFCEEVPTRHRCMHLVEIGGLATDGDLHICGEYICAPCSLSFGSKEGIFRCLEHSEKNDDESNNVDEDTQVVVKETKQRPSWKKRNESWVAAKGVKLGSKQSEYSAKDLLVLSQAFICVSDHAIAVFNRKSGKVWDDVAIAFNKLKEQQEAYNSRQRKKDKYNQILLKGDLMVSYEEDDVEFVLQVRTAGSLQQKWSKSVQPNVTKFISLTNRYPIRSGEGKVIAHLFIVIFDFFSHLFFFIHLDRDHYFNRIHLIYLE